MKDRNGVELQEGDVCAIHLSRYCMMNVVVSFVPEITNSKFVVCDDSENFRDVAHDETTWVKPKHLEIIGSVRDEQKDTRADPETLTSRTCLVR